MPLPGLGDFSFEVPAKHAKCFSPATQSEKSLRGLVRFSRRFSFTKTAGGGAVDGTVLMELYA